MNNTALQLYDIDNLLEDARRIYMSYEAPKAHEAIEPLIDICRMLAGIVKEQQGQIEALQVERWRAKQ